MIAATFAEKLGMTHVYDDKHRHIPVTVLRVTPHAVTAVLSQDKHGYEAVQVAAVSGKSINKPQKEELKKLGIDQPLSKRTEIRMSGEGITVGEAVTLAAFAPGDEVIVIGTSKGKGFSGGIKRYGWSRGPMSHGSKHHRAPGSIGSGYPQRVVPGKKLPGHMGSHQVTSKGHRVIAINEANNTIAISGPLPGANKSQVMIRKVG